MPKYCVEFIADVCTFPSQDDSDSIDSREEQEPLTVNPLGELDRDIRLTPFVVADQKCTSFSTQNKVKSSSHTTSPLPSSTVNSVCHCSRNSHLVTFDVNFGNSHVTSMGNTVCCLTDGKTSMWDESEHATTNFNRYSHDAVPVHRTFVISRAVQCGSGSITEPTMHNNHSYHDTLMLDSRNETFCQPEGEKSAYCSRNQKHLSFALCDEDMQSKPSDLKQNARLLTSVTSNSEMSVDVSSLSAQRCSSVTPPPPPEAAKNSINYTLDADANAMQSSAILLEDDMDSLSATISGGSTTNFRENSKRHRQRPAPYTKPRRKPSGQTKTVKHLNSTLALERLNYKHRNQRRRHTSLYPILGVSAFGDSLLGKSPVTFLQKPVTTESAEQCMLAPFTAFKLNKTQTEIRENKLPGTNCKEFEEHSVIMHSSSTLEETSSVSSLEQPQTVRFIASHPDHVEHRKRLDHVLMSDKISNRSTEKTTANVTNDHKQPQRFLEDTSPRSQSTHLTIANENGLNVKATPGVNTQNDQKDRVGSAGELKKQTCQRRGCFKLDDSPNLKSSLVRSGLATPVDMHATNSSHIPRTIKKQRALSESRIPTTQKRYPSSFQIAIADNRLQNVTLDERIKTEEDQEKMNTPNQPEVAMNESVPVTENPVQFTGPNVKDSSLTQTSAEQEPTQTLNMKVKPTNLRLSRSLERTTSVVDALDSNNIKPRKRHESFSAIPEIKKNDGLFIPLKAQLNSQAKLQLPKDAGFQPPWDHKSTQAETVSNVSSCMELHHQGSKPTVTRSSRQSTLLKRNSAPISLKLPQPIPANVPTKITTKPSPVISPTVSISIARRRSNESVLSVPLHIYTPQSRNRGKLVRHKFFIPETANIEAILADPDDRRIKAICERYKCDMEIYSKLPWCGFLQYIIVLAARDTATLRRCARTLDCRLNWCLTAQIR
ncbi:unnamed protein product [Echinostoma caproni]|uniref:Myb-like domain-containing protein n=1 Tax=Echinostoma caproni TaxID=27848 RepID=A0A183A0B3_9TREM|nr:unnamed protein product [Echinostoma caproni]